MQAALATQPPASAGIRSASTARIAATSSGDDVAVDVIRIGRPATVVEADLRRPATDIGEPVQGVAGGQLPDECREAIRAERARRSPSGST